MTRTAPRTKDNTKFINWWKATNAALHARGLREANMGEARGGWEIGDSPETFADYQAGDPAWLDRPTDADDAVGQIMGRA